MARCGGQAVIEYALLLGVVAAAVIGIEFYAKRGIQAGIKGGADALSPYNGPFAVNDADGERAQLSGLLYETGSQRFSITPVGRVLTGETAVETRTLPGEQVTTRDEFPGGSGHREAVLQSTTTGVLQNFPAGTSSFRRVVIEDIDDTP